MADITWLIAKIRGGKSLLAASWICRELEKSERMIVTNMPVWISDAPAGKLSLQEWCEIFVKRSIDVKKRVRVLTREESYEFWVHYPGFDLEDDLIEVPRRGSEGAKFLKKFVPNLQCRQDMQRAGEIPFGCFFVIDEVHQVFGNRSWAEIGESLEVYVSQLGKLNDDLILVTQHPEKVEKNLRRNATRVVEIQNMSKVRLWGGVSFNGVFRYREYPCFPQRGDSPTESGRYHIGDKRYKDVYDTMSGIGLSGGLMPEQNPRKGGHWIRWVGIAVVILAVAITFPPVAMKTFSAVFTTGLRSVTGKVSGAIVGDGIVGKKISVIPPAVGDNPRSAVPSRASHPSPAAFVPSAGGFYGASGIGVSSDVYWVGLMVEKGKHRVFLSDGRDYKENDGHLTVINPKTWIIVDNVRYLWWEHPDQRKIERDEKMPPVVDPLRRVIPLSVER